MSFLHTNPQAAIDLLNQIVADSGGQSQLTTAQILQSVLNQLMKAERALHLEQEPDDKGNGFYERQLGTPSGNLQLQVPRDRNGNFRPQVLPAIPHQRDSQDRYQLLDSLVNACYSPNQIDGVFDQLGLHYNPKEVERLKELYLAEFNAWKTRELPPDMIALFIDAYQAEMLHKGKVRKMTAFVAIGVDFRGHKELLGLYIHLGHESKEFWLQTLNDLIERGLKRLVAVVSDDFSGLKDAVIALMPKALHQLCFIHMQRNVRRNMGKEDANHFNGELATIKLQGDFEQGVTSFKALTEHYKSKYPTFMKALQADIPNYLAFLKLPKDAQKHFYTTNAVESFNSGLEKLRIRMGGFFQSEETFQISVFLGYKKLAKKWLKGMPLVKANEYLLRQVFAQLYGEAPRLN